MAARPSFSLLEAADFGLFFFYITLNLTWVCLRSLSIAVDEYVFYEKLELVRRVGNMATILAMLIGLPFTAFLVGSNVLWAVLVTSAVAKLLSRGAMAPQLRGFARELMAFFRTNMRSIARSGTFALSDIFIYTFPYYVVPWAFGLGAPIIILEATFRIFRGASVIYTAACDLAIPGQTRALAARDAPKLIRTTLIAAALCCLPAAFACGLLIFASKQLFAFLLGSAATVPPTVTPILVVMLLANLVQMVAQSLLLHAGFFREISRIGLGVAVAMVARNRDRGRCRTDYCRISRRLCRRLQRGRALSGRRRLSRTDSRRRVAARRGEMETRRGTCRGALIKAQRKMELCAKSF